MITSFAPNTRFKDVLISLKYLFLPWYWFSWQGGKNQKKLQKKMEKYFSLKNSIITYDSGRTALYKILRAYKIGEGDEIIIQAFTCVVVPNAIKYTGAKPVYLDIEEDTYNIDPQKIEKAINKKTKAIIIQHTFGLAAKLNEILAIASKHKLKVIEDCAHSLGGTYKGKKLGTFGDAAIFSFGVDKVIYSVRGGALLVKDGKIYEKLHRENLTHLPFAIIIKHLLHPPVFSLGKALYSLYIGKIILFFSKKLGLTALIIEEKEKKCEKVDWFPAAMPNCLAEIAVSQFSQLDTYNNHREKIASFYRRNLPNFKHPFNKDNIFLRYPLQSKKRSKVMSKAKKAGIFLGDWYDTVIAPKDINLRKTDYKTGSCKVAESVSKQVFNLPTHKGINIKKAQKIVEIINEAAN